MKRLAGEEDGQQSQKILLPRTFSLKNSPGNVFYGPKDPISDLVRRDPTILDQWVEDNPGSLVDTVRNNQQYFHTFCRKCDKIAYIEPLEE